MARAGRPSRTSQNRKDILGRGPTRRRDGPGAGDCARLLCVARRSRPFGPARGSESLARGARARHWVGIDDASRRRDAQSPGNVQSTRECAVSLLHPDGLPARAFWHHIASAHIRDNLLGRLVESAALVLADLDGQAKDTDASWQGLCPLRRLVNRCDRPIPAASAAGVDN